MKENRLLEVMQVAFENAALEHSDIIITCTYALRFDVYATDYSLKLKVMHAIEKCQSEGAIKYDTLMEAKKYYDETNEYGVKVIYHCAQDTDISIDREEVWMFHNFK